MPYSQVEPKRSGGTTAPARKQGGHGGRPTDGTGSCQGASRYRGWGESGPSALPFALTTDATSVASHHLQKTRGWSVSAWSPDARGSTAAGSSWTESCPAAAARGGSGAGSHPTRGSTR